MRLTQSEIECIIKNPKYNFHRHHHLFEMALIGWGTIDIIAILNAQDNIYRRGTKNAIEITKRKQKKFLFSKFF